MRYDPRDVAEIRVFHADRFLCRAICQELAGQTVPLQRNRAGKEHPPPAVARDDRRAAKNRRFPSRRARWWSEEEQDPPDTAARAARTQSQAVLQ